MNAHQQAELKNLLNQFSIFQRHVDEKLTFVVADTETSVIAALMAAKKIVNLIEVNQTSLIDHSHVGNAPNANHEVFKQIADQHANILGMMLEMQSHFQFHDIVRQTIERMQDAMSTCDDIMQSLAFAVDSDKELHYLANKMTTLNHEYQALEHLHAKPTSDLSAHIEFF